MSAPNKKKPKDGATILVKYRSEIFAVPYRWITGTYDKNARLLRDTVYGCLAWDRVICWWYLPDTETTIDEKTSQALDRRLKRKFGKLLN